MGYEMRTVAIIQARMGSTRLPNKVLMRIEGKPLLWHVAKRVQAAKLVDDVVVATSKSFKDDGIARLARENGIKVFRGSESNCLERYYKAAKTNNAGTIVRITGDSPLICPEIIDKVIKEFKKGKYAYATNTLLYTYPDGCDVEVFSFDALEKTWRECKDSLTAEHVTPYIKNSGRFKIKNVENKDRSDLSGYKWSVDKSEDIKFVRKIYKNLYRNGKIFSLKEILHFVREHPEIEKINKGFIINEGYYKSIIESSPVKPKKIRINKSSKLKKKTENIIPGCSQTFSKAPTQFVQGVAPVFLENGKASHVWDVDGNEYIDYAMALGPIILGHNYPRVSRVVKEAVEKSVTFSLPHRLETELAELLCQIIPCAEMVKFGKNGSDVTSAAVRVSRAYTRRDKVACSGYHGWQDWYVGTTTMKRGVPEAVRELTLVFEYNKIETLEKIFAENKNKIACVIMEPVGIVEPKNNFLQKVRDLTHRNGSVLVFDEVITGFRFSMGGAQEYFGVTPDLACFGKAMANGFPISAIAGRRKIMKLFKDVFYSFTFGGEIMSITAAIATIKELESKNVIKYLWEQGRKIKDGYNVLAREYGLGKITECTGFPPRTVIIFKDKSGKTDLLLKSLFQQECIKRGILFTGGHNMCFSHSNSDIDYTLRVYRTVLEILKEAIKKDKVKGLLEGIPVKPVFRKV